MNVSRAVGRALGELGVDRVFGLMGSGNLTLTNALREAGAPLVAARHEGGATSMADGYARVTGRVGVVSVHQGPGFTNTVTGLAEAAKARTPLLLLAADTPAAALRSNFRVDQAAIAESVGAVVERIHSPASAVADATRALARARVEHRAVVLLLPIDLQAMDAAEGGPAVPAPGDWALPAPAAEAVARAAELLAEAERPVIIAGRGAVRAGAGPALRELAERAGALLATSAPANGLFDGDPYAVGISGGFATSTGAQLLAESDVVVAFGASLNQWTTRQGKLVAGARLVQVDAEARAIGGHRPVDVGIVGDARAAAEALAAALGGRRDGRAGRRTPEMAARIAAGRWRNEPFEDRAPAGRVDPRAFTIALEDVLPAERTVVVDSGHFMGFPSEYLSVPDPLGFVFPQAFQCVGLGLSSAIGAALGRPDRLTVACLGDGGLMLALQELDTLARLDLPMLVVVYDDAAYGAEVHHFRDLGEAVDLAQFPDTDLAAMARGAGCEAMTVRALDDLDGIREWLGRRAGPLVVDVKVDPDVVADWLAEAFQSH
jgi:thiamine pyrophosphate-dependent acetolactate synthase large subunit-like protein